MTTPHSHKVVLPATWKHISPKEHYSPFSACSTLMMAHSPSSLGKNLNLDHQWFETNSISSPYRCTSVPPQNHQKPKQFFFSTRILHITNATPPPHSPPHHFHSSPNLHKKSNQPNGNARMDSMIMHQKYRQLFYRTEEYLLSRNILSTSATTSHTPYATTLTSNTD